MTSLRYRNPALNRRRKLLDKDKRERRTAVEIQNAGRYAEKKAKVEELRLRELEEEQYEN